MMADQINDPVCSAYSETNTLTILCSGIMFFAQAGSAAPRRRRGPEPAAATRLFVPPSTLVKSGGPRLVQDWVDHEALEKMKSSSDTRSYNVTGSLLNKRKGVTITPRRDIILSKVDTSVPGPGIYAPPPPPLLKPTFNKAAFRPQLPTKQRRSANIGSVSPRFRGMYLRQAPLPQDGSPVSPRLQQQREEEGGCDEEKTKDGSGSPSPLPAKSSLYSLMRELKQHFLEEKSATSPASTSTSSQREGGVPLQEPKQEEEQPQQQQQGQMNEQVTVEPEHP